MGILRIWVNFSGVQPVLLHVTKEFLSSSEICTGFVECFTPDYNIERSNQILSILDLNLPVFK